ncbi:MAG TPA: PQQ-binding-like beta-propeller repeat protein [Planctomycetota bacterium]
MKRSDLLRWTSAALLLALLLPARDAEAVIPSAFGPIQALLVILPQLILAFALGVVALFKPRTYKLLFAYLWAHKALSAALVVALALGVWGLGRLFTAGVTAEKTGDAWTAFRGGPSRTGATAGAAGPRRPPRAVWQVGADVLGGGGAVDSSPAVVGNRVYFGSGVSSVMGNASGALHAIDLDTGGRAWSWTGKGELPAPLRPVFASPAVGARYLVSGEGYHEDRDCRLIVLNLEPVRASGGKRPPALHAWVQTTSHVESSPAILDGRAFVGAGDDGFYAFDLAAGNVAWRIEGDAFYEIAAGPHVEALGKLVGKTVAAVGASTRVFTGESADANIHVLRVSAFQEAPPGPAPAGPSPTERVVIGKVVEAPKDAKRTKDGSGFRLEIATWIPDCESSPVAVDGKVIFGSGLGGNAVVCADAKTGAILWKTPVPHPAFGAPTVVDGKVLIGLGNGIFTRSDPHPVGAIVALALADGKPAWTLPTGDVVLGAVAVDGGRGYAGSRDGGLYVLDVKDGKLLQKIPVGAPMVCSPSLTADAVYVSTDAGKLLCVDRAAGKIRWTFPLHSPVIASPVASADKILVGTSKKGFLALAEAPGEEEAVAIRPWSGPGGGADRLGLADDRGLPAIPTDADGNCERKWPADEGLKRPVSGPVIACGTRVFVPFAQGPATRLAALDARTSKAVWEVDSPAVAAMAADAARVYVFAGGEVRALDAATGRALWGPVKAGDGAPFVALDGDRLYVPADRGLRCLRASDGTASWTAPCGALLGAPAAAHDLIVAATTGGLACLSAEGGAALWTVEGAPLAAPAVAGGRIFTAVRGQGKAKSTLQARALPDGALLWAKDLEDVVIAHAAATEGVVAVPCEAMMRIFAAADGKSLHELPVGPSPVPPAIARDMLVMGAEQRIAAFDLAAGEWPWNFKDQDHIGKATSAPVVAFETIWVGTSARGLVILGAK